MMAKATVRDIRHEFDRVSVALRSRQGNTSSHVVPVRSHDHLRPRTVSIHRTKLVILKK